MSGEEERDVWRLFKCPRCTGTWSSQQDVAGYERHYIWCTIRPGGPNRGES